MKGLAEEFQNQVTCLGENTEKYVTFAVSIEKEVTKINKNGEEITKNISYILQFIDSARFMVRPLSNLVDNLSEEIHRLSILEFSKILMYEFLYDYVKSKHGEQAKLGYIDTDSYIVYMETDDISKNIGEDFDLIWY